MFPLGFADPAICSFLADANSLWYAAIPGYMNAPGSGYGAGTIIPSECAHSPRCLASCRLPASCWGGQRWVAGWQVLMPGQEWLRCAAGRHSCGSTWLSAPLSCDCPPAHPPSTLPLCLLCATAGPLAAFVSPEAKAKQAAAISAYFRGQGTLARLARTQHPLMWMG